VQFLLSSQGRGCWRGPCRLRRQGGRAAAQGWGRSVARPGEPREPARLWRAGGAPEGRDGGAVSRGLAGPPGPAYLGRVAGRAAAAQGRLRGPLAAPATGAMRFCRRTLIERNSTRAPIFKDSGRQVNITCYVNPKGEQYAGERATCDNTSIIAKGGSLAHGDPRRAYRPAYGGACGRYAAGEGTPPCWAAAPLGRHTMARAGRGQAGRRGGSWAQGNRPCCPVRRRRIPRRIAACRPKA